MRRLNSLEIDLVMTPDPFDGQLSVRARYSVDGVDILDSVLNFEEPYMLLEGRPSIKQGRNWPYVYHRLLTRLRGGMDYNDRSCNFLDCRCDCDGCWELTCKIVRTHSVVKWKMFSNVHKDWSYSGFGPFIFDRKAYDSEIGKIEYYLKQKKLGLFDEESLPVCYPARSEDWMYV